MRDLNKALNDIALLRTQMARTSEFRGYGPTTLGATGGLAVTAALLQAHVLPDPSTDVIAYLTLWIATAALSLTLITLEVITRSRRAHSGLATEMIHVALEQLLPSVAAAVLLTWVMIRSAPQSVWLLPGIWQILLSLGAFASSRSLPRPMIAIGIWYMATGLACVAFANGDNALSPVAMGMPFGLGQTLAALLIYHQGKNDQNG